MIRKLVENLIIDVYEKDKKQTEIQQNGEYFMLSGLITAVLNQTYWTLGSGVQSRPKKYRATLTASF